MDFQTLDLFLTNLNVFLQKHGGFIFGISFLSLLVCLLIGGILAAIFVGAPKNESENKDDPANTTKPVKNIKARRLDEIERKHLELLSSYVACAIAIKNKEVSHIVFVLAGTVNMIFRKILETKKFSGTIQTFVKYHAPETLRLAQEYRRLSESAQTNILYDELLRTAQTLAGLNQDFMLYLAEFEKNEATALEILRKTREAISSVERPLIPGMQTALPPADMETGLLELLPLEEKKTEVPRG